MNSVKLFKQENFITHNEVVRIPEGDLPTPPAPPVEAPEAELPAEQAKPPDTPCECPPPPPEPVIDEAWLEAQKQARLAEIELECNAEKAKILERYERETERRQNEAVQQAYFDALNQKKSELRDCIAKVQQLLDEMITRQEGFMAQYVQALKLLSVDVAERFVLQKLAADEQLLHKLVLQSMQTLKNAEWVDVQLSEELVDFVEVLKRELVALSDYNGRVNVTTVPGDVGTLRFDTEDAVIDSSIAAQARNLRNAFLEADAWQMN